MPVKKTAHMVAMLKERREHPERFCPNEDCGERLEYDGSNVTKDANGNVTRIVVDTIMGNEWWETYLCPHCKAGHKKYTKDDTPGYRESFTQACCKCGNDDSGRGK